ncbi:MAG TPA: class II aldolase/adducin family protein [Anaerolineae bacterium]|nr:class II aldolase/adducin family protein [Anaerolineae bacterium]
MKFSLLHPRDQLVTTMERIYHYGMTTTSGGNLSILDENGDMWITPAGVDKGTLRPADIICVHPDGNIVGPHKPSSEYPFHRAIYTQRPDFRAIVHAHPPALVAFSLARQTPDTRILAQTHALCGPVGYAPYRLPGSLELGAIIAETFAQGVASVLLENHGIVAGGASLLTAFQRFETLDFCARTLIAAARTHNQAQPLSDEQLALAQQEETLPTFAPSAHTGRERELRQEIVAFTRRAYQRQLMTSAAGNASARVDARTFLITPHGQDRLHFEIEDLVLIQEGRGEQGKTPSRMARLHQAIYAAHPDIGAILMAQPPGVMAFGVAGQPLDTRLIPESYIMLRDIPLLPYGVQFGAWQQVATPLSPATPALLIQNEALLTTGATLLQAFDRMEVAEFSAQAVLHTTSLGALAPIGDAEIAELEAKFLS